MFPKRLIALTLLAAFAVMPPCVLHAQWVQTNGPYDLPITSMAVMGTYLFAGASNDYYTGSGVYRSTDSGQSWISVGGAGAAIAVSGSVLFSGDYGGVQRSTDSGNSWVSVLHHRVQGIAENGKSVFVSTEDGAGFYISTDEGTSWTPVGGGGQVLFATSDTSVFIGGGGVDLLTRKDTTWNEVVTDSGIPDLSTTTFVLIDQNLFVGTANGVFFSTNNGKSWTAASGGLTDKNVLSLASIGSTLFAGTDQAVFRSSNNGNSWTE